MEFEAYIQSGEKPEPNDWMPAKFLHQMVWLIQQHANSELIVVAFFVVHSMTNALPRDDRSVSNA